MNKTTANATYLHGEAPKAFRSSSPTSRMAICPSKGILAFNIIKDLENTANNDTTYTILIPTTGNSILMHNRKSVFTPLGYEGKTTENLPESNLPAKDYTDIFYS